MYGVAFARFRESTEYFASMTKSWMISLHVRSPDAMVAQQKSAGINVAMDAHD